MSFGAGQKNGRKNGKKRRRMSRW